VTIYRGKMPTDHFTMIPNAWVRDHELPWAARGLLVWLLSHAHGYKISETLIVAAGPTGRDGVRTMLQALEKAGYLKRRRTPIPGSGSEVDYELTDPSSGFSDSPDDVTSDPRPDQREHGVAADDPSSGFSDSLPTEDQEKTKKTTTSSSRATRIPENFMPDEKMRAWFADEKLAAAIDGRVEHEKFCDYWAGVPGVKGRKLDWAATWRNWMRSAAERAGRRPGTALAPTSGAPYRPSTTDQRISQGLALAAKYREQGQ